MVEIKVGKRTIEVQAGSNLREELLKAGFRLDSPCGGRGSCGKCKVHVEGKAAPPSEEERALLGADLAAGLRLACRVTVEHPLQVRLPDLIEQVKVERTSFAASSKLGAAVDIGTTTVAGYLLDLETSRVLATASCRNPQADFGADVISRLAYALEGSLDKLTAVIRRAVAELLVGLAGEERLEVLSHLVLVGNSAMHHLWWGLDPKSLAVAPYKPVSVLPKEEEAKRLGLPLPKASVYFLPLVAGFVGADTVAAALATGITEGSGTRLMVDIGTNGELVLATGTELYTCATAAGPALEGAEISCGMRGEPGAIEAVKLGERVEYKVIGDVEPVGICGSGLVDLLAELVRTGLVDSTGRLLTREEFLAQGGSQSLASLLTEDSFQVTESVSITGGDVRKLQLAKGAIRAGMETLLSEAGLKAEKLDEIILAGAFGSFLNPNSAIGAGLLPPVDVKKVHAAGNAAGEGAKLVLLDPKAKAKAEEIAQRLNYIELATRADFQTRFMEAMLF